MIERKYLVDNNALGFIGSKRRVSAFFRNHCRVTEDVAYEARFTVKSSVLSGLIEPVTPAILRQATKIMATVPVGDIRLINLYGNKGTADPLLVATALVLNERESLSLFGDEWIVVTRDSEVTKKAKEFDVQTATPEELAAIIDAAE